MHRREQQEEKRSIIAYTALSGASAYVMQEYGPVLEGITLNPIPTLALGVCFANGMGVVQYALQYMAEYCEWRIANIVAGYKATSSWANLKDIKKISQPYGFGPYWGVFSGTGAKKNKPHTIIADYKSNAVTFGPAGSGKDVGVVVTNILSIFHSKIILDFKSNLFVMTADALRKRGEHVIVLNIGDLNSEFCAEKSSYNPLHLICDDYETSHSLQDVVGDCSEFANQIYPEPADGGNDKYFRDGSRDLIIFCMQHVVLVYGRQAHIGHVAQMLADKSMLLKDAKWAAGLLEDSEGNSLPEMPLNQAHWTQFHSDEDVQNYIAYYRAKAAGLAELLSASDSRTADSFLTGAQQALADFNIASRAGKILKDSTFKSSDLKDPNKITTVFLSMDASRMTSQAKILSLIQFCAFTELKRHKNHHVPIYIIANETTNCVIYKLNELLTWGREFGIRIHLFIQALAAYRKVYGKDAADILITQCEILQFLPGQKGEMLELIENLLGHMAYINRNHSGKFHGFHMQGHSLSEETRPLMNKDEIRRTPFTLLFIRSHKPILTMLPPYSAIHPWRNQVAPNPMQSSKKKWKLPIQLRIGKRKPSFLRRFASFITRGII